MSSHSSRSERDDWEEAPRTPELPGRDLEHFGTNSRVRTLYDPENADAWITAETVRVGENGREASR